MRRVCLATLLCLSAGVSSVGGAPPNRQHIIDQQQQLIEAQRTEDGSRQAVETLVEQLRERYGDVSGLRIASDQLSHMNRARDARAAKFWELLGITVPLQHPLADSQRAELESFIGAFKGTAKDRFASALLNEHKSLVSAAEAEHRTSLRASEAKERLASVQLKTITDELSEPQFTQLIKIDKEFSTTDSAAVARRYLKAHFNRRSREDVREAGLLAPEMAEPLARQRLTEAQDRNGHARDKQSLRQALAEIVDDYPGTQAGQQASAQLALVQKQLILVQNALNAEAEHARSVQAAEAERSRSVRDYWDSVYPSRTSKLVGVQR